jgi:hypothetical protein
LNSRNVKFAIGCFHFGLIKVHSGGMASEDYLEELNKSLESISNINNLDIYTTERFDSLSIGKDAEFTTLHEGDNFFPFQSVYPIISFDIYIPERLQDELYPHASSTLNTERFRVHIRNAYHFPVTFVELISAKNDSEPSMAVVVIREFLEQQFAEKNPEYIRFECLGPSPFHADFSLSKGNDKTNTFDSNGFSVNCLHKPGYDQFVIHYSSKHFSSLQDAKESLFAALSADAGAFYKIVHSGVLEIYEWGYLEEEVNGLIETNKLKGIKSLWFQAFRLSQQVQDVVFSLSGFESHRILESFARKKSYEELKKDGRNHYLMEALDDELSQIPDYPTNQIKDIIELLESRRSKRIDNLVVLTASIIGGIIGAVITMLVAR